jgi:hypothetical protein
MKTFTTIRFSLLVVLLSFLNLSMTKATTCPAPAQIQIVTGGALTVTCHGTVGYNISVPGPAADLYVWTISGSGKFVPPYAAQYAQTTTNGIAVYIAQNTGINNFTVTVTAYYCNKTSTVSASTGFSILGRNFCTGGNNRTADDLGTTDAQLENTLYPNPVNAGTEVQLSGSNVLNTQKVVIKSTEGKEINTHIEIGEKISISTQSLSKGIYFVQLIYNDGNSTTHRFSVE